MHLKKKLQMAAVAIMKFALLRFRLALRSMFKGLIKRGLRHFEAHIDY